ncbi:Shikimate kinase II [Methanosarcina siciliae C2J]|uniref:Shikimate kinase n=3 Tax=Methanosarcina siciliae TaxID=38027 RepID=A0A0E3PDM2_9EURY|nr:shikimate kinase [Methanosarcina siciliae]AKB28392.1 Shikimate kinase II [Methanosarcina siciliae T4/M]AKB32263.1 Shikimate kinase II [Methanosarcina siciliae HI350]AKB35975.1 Shikimate kinase II [Methanosarcina siciliae C2J]
MTFEGYACAFGAGTIINAIATWKGAAFGIDLKTFAETSLSEGKSGIEGSIDGMPEGDTRLMEHCVELVLELFGLELEGTIKTGSEIPIAGGLKSSSAAANASVLATLRAVGETLPPLEIVKLGVRAAKEVGVTVTGAFDDACASFLGGIVVTDNRKMELVRREEADSKVLIFAPAKKAFSADTNVKRSRLIAPYVEMAYELALKGEYERAMTLNGFLYCGALGFDTEYMLRALECGVTGVSLSGTGPSYAALVKAEQVKELKSAWESCGIEGKIIETSISNRDAISFKGRGPLE